VIFIDGKKQFFTNAIDIYIDSIIYSFDIEKVEFISFPAADFIEYYEL
jgi:hypothetical protein